MSISSITSGQVAQQWSGMVKERRQDFKDLANALQSGDLTAAQDAFASLKELHQSRPVASKVHPGGPVEQDFTALQDALNSGDLTEAQDAFKQLTTDVKSAAKEAFSRIQEHRSDIQTSSLGIDILA